MSGDDEVDEPPTDERGRLLSRLAATLASLPSDAHQTWKLCEALRRLFGADGAVITLAYLSDARTTLCTTDDVAAEVENLQEILGEGPGHDAASSNEVVIADIDGNTHWPMLAQAVDERLGSIRLHAIPLRADDELPGVVTFHTRAGTSLAESPENMGVPHQRRRCCGHRRGAQPAGSPSR